LNIDGRLERQVSNGRLIQGQEGTLCPDSGACLRIWRSWHPSRRTRSPVPEPADPDAAYARATKPFARYKIVAAVTPRRFGESWLSTTPRRGHACGRCASAERRVLLRDAGEFDRLAVRKFRHEAEAATHSLDGFPQSRNHQVGALLDPRDALLSDPEPLCDADLRELARAGEASAASSPRR
jgi:hypothetical protein